MHGYQRNPVGHPADRGVRGTVEAPRRAGQIAAKGGWTLAGHAWLAGLLSLSFPVRTGKFEPEHQPMEYFAFSGNQRDAGNPQTEVEILTKVASYGSQLGTVIDALMVVMPDQEKRKALNDENRDAVLKLVHLAGEIKRIKEG